MKILLSPDPEVSGSLPAPSNNPPVAEADPPPAAATVINGDITEDTAKLKDDLESERRIRKEREQRINELEDQNRQLKQVPKPAPVKKADPLTVFDWE